MNLFRRALGALPDAAWLRRQFTEDADVVHDVKHGARMLLKSPSFALSAVLILAIGIGGTVSIATLLDTLQFRPLAYQDAERVVTLWQRQAARPAEREDVSPADFLDWRDRARSFSVMAGVIPYSMDFTGGTEPEVLFGAQVTEGFFDAIGMAPMIGRGFLPDEHVRGARRAVVITYGFWQSRYAGDPAVVNKTISMDGEPWTIVGVLPKSFAPQLLPRPGELVGLDTEDHPGAREADSGERMVERRRAAVARRHRRTGAERDGHHLGSPGQGKPTDQRDEQRRGRPAARTPDGRRAACRWS